METTQDIADAMQRRIKRLPCKKGDFFNAAKVTPSVFYRWLNGDCDILLSNLLKLEKTLTLLENHCDDTKRN